jgi:hypothetical protein
VDESMRRIGESIHAERRNLDRNLAELEQHVLSMADWRTHYRNHTWAAVGIAAGTGLVMGMLTAVSPRAYRERGGRAWSALAQLDHHGRTRSRLGETWDGILDALLGVASSAAIHFVSRHVPGFQEEFGRAAPLRSTRSHRPT